MTFNLNSPDDLPFYLGTIAPVIIGTLLLFETFISVAVIFIRKY